MVRALASHQCGPGWISNLSVICVLSLLVLYSAIRGVSLGTLFSPLIKNLHLIKFDLYTTPQALSFKTYRVEIKDIIVIFIIIMYITVSLKTGQRTSG